MKKNHFTSAFFFLFMSCYASLIAQPSNKCGTMQYLQQRIQQDPSLAAKLAANEIALQKEINTPSNNKTALTTYIIPVVVHVLWHTAAENISHAQVWSQIDVLNEDFGRTNGDTLNTPGAFQPFAANTNIQFCLAQTDTNGNPTNGIEYTQTWVTAFPPGNVMSSSTGGAEPWDPDHYFNIYVCNMTGGLLAVGITPGAGIPAAIVQYNVFGRTGNVTPPYDKGRNTTHAIGHCFNLRHIWGDDNGLCSGDDLVGDTPNQANYTFGCPPFPVTDACTPASPGIMFMNYMDYSDDACMNMFTQGQGARMAAAITTFYPLLSSSSACIPPFAQVNGKVFYDTDQNGLQDTNDIGLNAQKITTLPDSNFYFTNYFGEYNSYFDTGSVNTIQFNPQPVWILTSDSASYSVLSDSALKCCYNFGTAPTVFFDSLIIGMTDPGIKCAMDNPVWVYYKNIGTTVAAGIIKFLPDDSLLYVTASPPPSNFSGDTIVWNYVNLQPGEFRLINIILHGPDSDSLALHCYAEIDLYYNGSYIPAAVDSEDTFDGCSFDPNFKEVYPPGILAQHYTLKNIPLEYTIAFQNLGSGTAYNVILRDTLSSLLNRNTFQLMGSSHSVNTSLNNQNILEFRFNNINLPPESMDETGSRGFVTFKITPNAGLPDGTVINNQAAIYFDFNAPVITNNVFNTLFTPTGVENIKDNNTLVSVKPVPFKNNFEIILETKNNNRLFFSVFDATGNSVLKMEKSFPQLYSRQVVQINSKSWSKGIYFLKITDESGNDFYSGKLMKE